MSRLGILPGTGPGGAAPGPLTAARADAPAWVQRLEAARDLAASVEADPRRVEHLADHRAIPVLGGLDGALTYLYRRWVTLYGAALDAEPDGARFGPATLERVRRRVSGEHPGLVRILAQYSSHPALGAARDHHRHLLREATGGSSERG